eukprot:TRINITY_DN4421_c0_g1_i1.p1 TRINITY_DN4421_c0_g1~~TRINITY_DN4421_c0_g1_i1.p1  ORF type:complete len:460 (-),score=86.96 TRINITY_DN4421_c0_g1_i1:43-1422(-)
MSDPILQGTFYKCAKTSKKWVKRNFVLFRDRLSYSRPKRHTKTLKDIDLKDVLNINIQGKSGKDAYIFIVDTSQQNYRFKALTQEDAKIWVDAISDSVVLIRQKQKKKYNRTGDAYQNQRKSSDESHELQVPTHGNQQDPVSIEDFERMLIVGKGTYGVVYLCEHRETGEQYAMKVINKEYIRQKNQIKNTMAEMSILARMRHPFIMRLHYAFQSKNSLYLILDFVNGGELFRHLEFFDKLNEDRARFYIAEIILAIEFLHENGIMYRDLKPENVLIDASGHIVLTDFGLSKELEEEELTDSFCGTPEYFAPEMIGTEGYTMDIDWYAIGILLYEIVVGSPPFESEDEDHLYRQILNDQIRYPKYLSSEVVDLISCLTKKEKADRLIDPEEIKKHPFFSQIDWEKLYEKEIEPPYIPDLDGPDDLDMIDSEYLKQSFDSSTCLLSIDTDDTFREYMYGI